MEETSSVAYLVWGFQWEGTTTFRCWGNSLECSVYTKCQALGGGWTVGVAAGFDWVRGKNCKCAEHVTDTSSISGGASVVYATWSQGPKCGGWTFGGATNFLKAAVPSAYLRESSVNRDLLAAASEDRMSRGKIVSLGIAVSVPPAYFLLFVTVLLPTFIEEIRADNEQGDPNAFLRRVVGVLVVHLLMMAVELFVLVYFAVHLYRSPNDSRNKMVWALALLFGNVLAAPVYYYFHFLRRTVPLPPEQ